MHTDTLSVWGKEQNCSTFYIMTSLSQLISVSIVIREIMRLKISNEFCWDTHCELSDMMYRTPCLLKYTLPFLRSHIWMLDALYFPCTHFCYRFLPTSLKRGETYKPAGFSGLSPARFLSQAFQFDFTLSVHGLCLAKLSSGGMPTRIAGVWWHWGAVPARPPAYLTLLMSLRPVGRDPSLVGMARGGMLGKERLLRCGDLRCKMLLTKQLIF